MSNAGLVVVGAGLAGLRAVEAARKAGYDGALTLIGAEDHLPYDRPPLSKAYLDPALDASTAAPVPPYFRTREHLEVDLGVHLMLGAPATGLDPEARVVQAAGTHVPYEALVIAAGSTPNQLPQGHELSGVQVLRSLEDAVAARAAFEGSARVVVIGAGFIGSEIASSARKRGLEATIVEAMPTPLVRATGQHMGAALSSLHHRNGTTLLTDARVERLVGQSDGRVERVILADGTSIPADLVVVGVGVRPATDWLAGSGIDLDNGVLCDHTLATNLPGVYAAGDVANWVNPVFGSRMRMENWTAAAEQGAAAARNALAPAEAKPYATVPYFWSDWYGLRIQFVGIPEADEVVVVAGDPERAPHQRWVALYRSGERLVGALSVQGQTDIMKYRVLIAKQATFTEGVALAEKRAAAATAKATVAPR